MYIREGCLESGKSIFHGGAKYNAIQSEIIGLTNVANSKNTDEYKNLVVRIGGFNAYFTELSKEIQDEVIARTEQVV